MAKVVMTRKEFENVLETHLGITGWKVSGDDIRKIGQ